MPGVEIHAEAGGKIIVTLETASEADIVERMNAISLFQACCRPRWSSTISNPNPSPRPPDKRDERHGPFTPRLLKAQAASAAAAAANVALPAEAQNLPTGADIQLQWSKAPCRFCGTGCGVMVGRQGRPGGRDPRRHEGGGQPRPQLREGLLPLQDHVRRRPADPAPACA